VPAIVRRWEESGSGNLESHSGALGTKSEV